jgi:hypothetical protein
MRLTRLLDPLSFRLAVAFYLKNLQFEILIVVSQPLDLLRSHPGALRCSFSEQDG